MKKDKAIFIIEGKIPENMHHELSKKIDEISKSFGLESHLDDVCEHNNTITNECSDCNENELYDSILRDSLCKIMDLLTDVHNVIPELIDEYGEENNCNPSDEIKEKVEDEIYRRLNTITNREE